MRESGNLFTDNLTIEKYLAAQGVCSTDNPISSKFLLDVTSNQQFQDTKVISSETVDVASSVVAKGTDSNDPLPIKTVCRIIV